MAEHHIELLNFTNLSRGERTPGELVKYAAEQGMNTVAICDYDSLQGFPEFCRECKKYKIKALYGVIFTVATPEEVPVEIIDVICFARNQQGIEALYQLYNSGRFPETQELLRYRQDLLLGLDIPGSSLLALALGEVMESMFIPDFALIDDEMNLHRSSWRAFAQLMEKDVPLCASEAGTRYFSNGDCIEMSFHNRDELLSRFDWLGDMAEEVIDNPGRVVADQIDARINPLPRLLPDRGAIYEELAIEERCMRRMRELCYGGSENWGEAGRRFAKELQNIKDHEMARLVRLALEIDAYYEEDIKGPLGIEIPGCPLISCLLGLTENKLTDIIYTVDPADDPDGAEEYHRLYVPQADGRLFAHLHARFPDYRFLKAGQTGYPDICYEDDSSKNWFETEYTLLMVRRDTILPLDRKDGEEVLHFDIRSMRESLACEVLDFL